MPIFNYKAKEMIVKIVYYGPGLGGKTTSLQHLHEKTIPDRKGELYFLATETDQTIYFELLPLYVGEIKSFKLRFQVYTVPGQVKYNNTRKAVLQGVDAIVFVADSQRSRREANLISFKNLQYNLQGGYNLLLKNLPLVYEYNKRDMRDLLTIDELNQDLNPWNAPYFETIAIHGEGILDAFESISSLAIQSLEERLLKLEEKAPLKKFIKDHKQPPQSSVPSQPEKPQTTAARRPQQPEHPLEESRDKGPILPFSEEEREPRILPVEEDTPILPISEESGEEGHLLSYIDILAVTYHDGEIIFEEGDTGNEMYFIEVGRVRIIGSYKNTKKVLAIYEKGDFFGEMALFGGNVRSARAVAIGTTRLIPITKKTLASQIQSRPEIATAILKTLSERIRNDTLTISRLADQNKDLRQHLKKARDTIKQCIDQNKLLRQKLEASRSQS
ncbi:cyclic nucleotide-binding domain-containing protein [candidate division KSB3 bacterium]|uniref:Cyclic nucleotide-binding domain-containing protein n=1 Tax=candidate division KSB3 bacterium TaxID=2044937 RepID=A0A9D5Q829_9BACT|nr:cyclic nucleotide-binding domain-containing protein [candidate division KSB3 bacterium]MBD3327058.1 cyclic nucleotide-binding domain-containing protein [candidate division KSB3 bacterium]